MITLHAIAVLLVAVAIFCRARHMDATTPTLTKVQHGVALVVAIASLPMFVPFTWGPELLGLALYLFVMLEARSTQGAEGGMPQ